MPFYGVGAGSARGDRVSYRLRTLDVVGTATLKPTPWLDVVSGVAWRRMEDDRGLGSRPSIESRQTPLTTPGLFSEVTYAQATAFAAIDSCESPSYTRRGGLYSPRRCTDACSIRATER